MQTYKTLGAPATASIVEKKSEFIAYASFAKTVEAALELLAQVRAQHRTAAHNVYAYILREDNRQRYSDDGEPAKTAGLPVLSVLTHAGLTDCIIVVTRYFGGTLLGTGGLVRAYTAAAQAALSAADILTMRQCVTLSLRIPYPLYEPAQRLFEQAGAQLAPPVYAEDVTLVATLPDGRQEALSTMLDELCRGKADIHISSPFFTAF